jgi:radical SAM-linked protein
VPRPHTPFQWERQQAPEELDRRGRYISSRLRGRGLKVHWRDPQVSLLECALARGDRRIAAVIEEAWRSGSRFDGWTEQFDIQKWRSAFQKSGFELDDFAGEIPLDRTLAWDHIDPGVSRDFLVSEREKAYHEQATRDCRIDGCYGCGVDPRICPSVGSGTAASVSPDPLPPQNAGGERFGRFSKKTRGRSTAETPSGRLRLKYSKKGKARFLSHLDTIRIIGRAIRAASLPIAYSKGHNPHQELSFGPPLPLGMTSCCEYVDMTFSASTALDIIGSLNSVLPVGIEAVSAGWIERKTKSLMSSISMTGYKVRLRPEPAPGRADLKRIVDKGLAGLDEDVRKLISRVEATGDGELEIDLIAGDKGHPRPDRIIPEMLVGLDLAPNQLDYERIAQYMYAEGKLIDPLEEASRLLRV